MIWFLAFTLFAIGSAAGFVMHRSDFCLAGAFRDLFLFRQGRMLRVLLLLAVVAMPLYEVGRLLGLLAVPFPLFGPPSLVNPLGGLLFGIGMVLAGGCVVGTLYKMAAGRLTSLVAFAGLLAGSTLYAEIHPWWAKLARRGTLSASVTLPQMLDLSPALLLAPLAVVVCFFLCRWWQQGLLHQESYAEGHLQPWKAALWLALLSCASALVVGMPMGVTTAYAKLAGMLEALVVPGHVANLAFFATEPLNFIHPLWGIPLRGGPGPRLDGIALAQFPLIAGILCGSACSALRLGEWRFYTRVPIKQCLWAFVGGTLMGLSARMAPACNVWHLMGGLPILAGQSLLFVAGLFPGAWLGSRLLRKFVI